MKKLIASIMMIALIAMTVAEASKTEPEKAYYEADRVLDAFEIIESDDYKKALEGNVTRDTFVNALMRTLYRDSGNISASDKSVSVDKRIFTDVEPENYAAFNIMRAFDEGIVNGRGDGSFGVDMPIKTDEAVYMMVKALGYGYRVTANGGYGAASNREGDNIKLRESTNAVYGEELSLADAKIMLYNMLMRKPVEFEGATGDGVRYKISEKYLMNKVFEAEFIEGVVVVNEYVSLMNDKKTGRDEIIIESDDGFSEPIDAAEFDTHTLIGMNVMCVYTKPVGGKIKAIMVSERMEEGNILTLSADEIDSFDDDKYIIRYTETKQTDRRNVKVSEKKVSFEKTADVIHNDVSAKDFSAALDMINDAGNENIDRVILVDTDNDSKYDMVKIYTYYTMMVSAINAGEKSIYDYESKLSLKLDDEDMKVIISDADGKRTGIESIGKNVILSVFESGSDIINIVICEEKVGGEIMGITNEDDKMYFEIGNERYSVSATVKDRLQNMNSGGYYTFYLDYKRAIAGISNTGAQEARFAIVANGFYDEFEGCLILKMFNDKGEMKRYTLSEKFKLNDMTVDCNVEGLKTLLQEVKGKLVDFSCDSKGRLLRVKTPTTERGVDTLAYSWGQNVTNDRFQYKLRYKAQSGILYHEGTGSGMIAVNSNTKIFFLPGLDTKNAQDNEYMIGSTSNLKGEDEYIMEGYSITKSSSVSDVLLVYGGEAMSTLQNLPAVVIKCVQTLNEDEDTVYKITARQGSSEVTYETVENIIKDVDSSKDVVLEKGDLIRFRINSRGECDGVKIVKRKSEKTDKYIRTGNYGDEYRYVLASVYSTDGSFCYIMPPENIQKDIVMQDGLGIEMHNISRPSIAVIDKDGYVRNGTPADIIGYEQNNATYTRQILIYTYWGQPSSIYVYE